MIEISEQDIETLNKSNEMPSIYFCYTPFCGTCKLAKQMLNEWTRNHSDLTIYSLNLNLNRKIAFDWKIKSVPYVSIFINGVKVHEFYAFHTINNIDRQLSPFLSKHL